MKSYLVLSSLVVIFAVGGIGIVISNSDITSQNSTSSVCIEPSFYEKLKDESSYFSTLKDFDFYNTSHENGAITYDTAYGSVLKS